MSAAATAELILLGIQIGTALVNGIAAAKSAQDTVKTWVDEGRDPTPAELAALRAQTDALMAQIRGA